jgi:hypothetical protein
MSTGSSPTSRELRICRPRDSRLTRGRKASTRWSCCSTGARCAASPAISFEGGGTRRRTMSGYGWRSWRTVRRKWRSMPVMPRPRAAAMPPADMRQHRLPLRQSSRPRRCWRSRPRLSAPPPDWRTGGGADRQSETGFRLEVPAEVVTGQALVGRTVLFRWPTAARAWSAGPWAGRRSRAAGFSHVVRDRRWALL